MTTAAIFKRFPEITFRPGKRFVWSPQQQVVYYDRQRLDAPQSLMTLLHEIGHAQLGHQAYEFDIELINMEVEAWDEARKLAKHLGVKLDEPHIQSCVETYRTWIYKRSRCPECANSSVQQTPVSYRCFNCGSSWQVAQTRTTQPRRMRCIIPN